MTLSDSRNCWEGQGVVNRDPQSSVGKQRNDREGQELVEARHGGSSGGQGVELEAGVKSEYTCRILLILRYHSKSRKRCDSLWNTAKNRNMSYDAEGCNRLTCRDGTRDRSALEFYPRA